ncbi:MAG: FmdB family transcriptional regulator [Actinobacteria bacterium]|jgi:putative FmdB family regulatory protein|nr:FmdB family transcriptional regulator [Actinomycetota bacterium]
MPTYMYKCRDCGHRFEEVQGFHDDPVQTCPDCGGQVQRVIGNVGVTFKGSGFYRTDSRSTKSSAPSAPKKSEGSTSSSEAAPAKKDSPAPKSTGGSSTST